MQPRSRLLPLRPLPLCEQSPTEKYAHLPAQGPIVLAGAFRDLCFQLGRNAREQHFACFILPYGHVEHNIRSASQHSQGLQNLSFNLQDLQHLRYSGRVSQPLPRFQRHQQHAEDLRKVAKIVFETGGPAAASAKTISRVAHGDADRLRGLPAIGRGVRSVSPGTDPLAALIAKQNRPRT
jgi:hypothetical protein